MDKKIVKRIVNWAKDQKAIKTIILEGSIATDKPTDWLSDFDLSVFVTDASSYLDHNEWIYRFDDVIIYQKTSFEAYGYLIPSRLVVYKNSPRVDFAFYPLDVLANNIARELPEPYKNGYRVILDKEGYTDQLDPPTGDGFIITKPAEDVFLKTIYNFWYEVYCVAKYLHRERLFFSKLVENSYIKEFLLNMILWYESGRDGWQNNEIHQLGKNLELKVSKRLRDDLTDCFSGYNIDDTWASLYGMTRLFKRLSIEVAKMMGVEYPEERVNEVERFIQSIKERASS